MLYLIVLVIFSLLGIGLSYPIALAHGIPLAEIFFNYLSSAVFCGVVCGAGMLISRFFTKRCFNPNSKLLHVFGFEIKIYQKLKVKEWKSFTPDLGFLVGFKKNLDKKDVKNSDFYLRFIFENVNAELLHGLGILLSPILFAFIEPHFRLTIGLAVFAMAFIFNIVPVAIQRYNRPRLLKMYNKTKAREVAVLAVA